MALKLSIYIQKCVISSVVAIHHKLCIVTIKCPFVLNAIVYEYEEMDEEREKRAIGLICFQGDDEQHCSDVILICFQGDDEQHCSDVISLYGCNYSVPFNPLIQLRTVSVPLLNS